MEFIVLTFTLSRNSIFRHWRQPLVGVYSRPAVWQPIQPLSHQVGRSRGRHLQVCQVWPSCQALGEEEEQQCHDLRETVKSYEVCNIICKYHTGWDLIDLIWFNWVNRRIQGEKFMVRFLAEFRDAANPHYDLSAEKLDTNTIYYSTWSPLLNSENYQILGGWPSFRLELGTSGRNESSLRIM